MANRFPLIVNPSTKKIEELVSGDNIDLTGNGLVANNTLGTSGQYLKSNGTTVVWDNPGDVYLTATQTVTNKTFNACILSGSTNTFSNIPNTALVNSGITINGITVSLGGSVTTPDNNTTYSISAVDGTSATQKIIRLTSGGNAGSGVDDDITLVAGSNVTLSRTGDAITINSSYVDTNTVTTLQSAVGGTAVTGAVTISASGSSVVSQTGNTINIESTYVDTITRLRGTTSGTYVTGDITFQSASPTTLTVAQNGNIFNLSSTDTVTRIKGGASGSFQSGDITLTGGGFTTVTQSGNTVTISSTDADTITRVAATGFTLAPGDFRIAASGSVGVTQATNAGVTTITLSGTDTNTTYSASSTGGLSETSTVFSLKNATNFTDARLLKWDNSNKQFTNSIISDNGSVVTISGGLTVTGSVTTIDTTTLVVADNEIELRRGNSLVGSDSGIKVNRTTNASGVVQTYNVLQWFESGGYWRSYDGSIANRFVTESEVQTLTNKTLSSPILTSPTLGIATATTINGLAITNVASGTLTLANNKTLTCNSNLTFSGTDSGGTVTVGFGTGGTVAYTSNNLSVFASTSSAQLRGVISDETGTGSLVFGTSPTITTSIVTDSTTFAVFNTTATTINAFQAATSVVLGATTGTTRVRNSLQVDGSTTLGDVVGDLVTINGTLDIVNADFTIRGTATNPMHIGRGGNAIATNTRVGFNALNSNTTGSQNTALGFEAGLTLNTGAGVVALGYRALRAASIGQFNVAIGRDAMLATLNGEKNVGVGANTLEGNVSGNSNVAIGHYAGAGATGNGNVLIGPAPDGNNTNATHTPPTPSGDNQLVIGSGTGTWVRGDSNFDVTFPQNANVGGNFTVSGNLTVNGTTTTINTNVLSIDDKLIDLADVSARNFSATIVSGSPNISAISPVTGLIPGMVVSITTAGLSVPNGTTIVSITNNTAVLSNNVSGSSGTAAFTTTGATDTTADGGGIRVKGTTDKSITYTNSLSTWTSTEHFDLATGKQYRIGNVQIANGTTTTIGPASGTWQLGAGVTTSSLTSVGTLTSLNVSGNATFDTNTLYVDATNNRVHIGEAGTAQSTFNISGTGGQGGGIQINRNTTGNPTSGQSLGSIAFKGVTSANSNAAGEVLIEAIASENHSGSTAGTELAIYTKPSGTGPGSAPTKRVTISSGGNLTLATGGRLTAIQYGNVGDWSALLGQIRLGAGQYGNLIQVVNDTNLNISANNFIYFNTGAATDGSTSGTAVANFGPNGLYMASGKGIDFSANANASGMTSELLDDYEEGTFTFTVVPGGGSYQYNYGNTGYYTKIGELVYINAWVHLTVSSAVSGSITFNGLPFTVAGTGTRPWIICGGYNHASAPSTSSLFLIPTEGSTTGIFTYNSSTFGTSTTVTAGNLPSSSEIYINGCYRAS